MIYEPFIKTIGYRPRYFHTSSGDDSYEVPTSVDTEDELLETSNELPKLDFSWLQDIDYKFTDRDSFKSRMLQEYKSALKAKGLNPDFAKYLVAQDALESGWGSKPSGLYNFGNITGSSGKTLEVPEYINGKWETKSQNFVNFNSIQDYVQSKIALLSSPRYDVFNYPVSEFVSRVVSGGYATAPNYGYELGRIIKSMRHGGILQFKEGGKEYLTNNREHFNNQVGPIFGNWPYHLAMQKLDGVKIVDESPWLLRKNWDDYHGVLNKLTNTIHINKNSSKKDIARNHELGHIIGSFLIKNIEKLIKKWDGKIFLDDSTVADSYYDSAKEIGARMYAYLQDSTYRGGKSVQDTLRFVDSERNKFTSSIKADITHGDNRYRSVHDGDGNISFLAVSDPISGVETKLYKEYNDPYGIYDRYNDHFIKDLIQLFYATDGAIKDDSITKNNSWHAPLNLSDDSKNDNYVGWPGTFTQYMNNN